MKVAIRNSGVALFSSIVLVAVVQAHDGEVHRDPADAAPVVPAARAERPQFAADGALIVPKATQRRLGLRTTPWSQDQPESPLRLIAEVQAQPFAAANVVAPESGRLEAPDGGWLLPGAKVRAGTVLAWLRPVLSQREQARRRALIADIDQQLVVANLNVERQELQNAVNVNAGGTAENNIYYDRYVADRDALKVNRDLLAKSLDDRLPLKAAVSGRLISAAAHEGERAAAGAVLFRIADGDGLRLVARHDHPGLGAMLSSARVADSSASLRAVGDEPEASGKGWLLRFDVVAGGDNLLPGQRLAINVQTRTAAGRVHLPAGACVGSSVSMQAMIWIHREAERFEPRRLTSCADAALTADALHLEPGDRLVTDGAALLALYR